MKFKNVLIASDFDGTLKTDEGIIQDEVIEKIQYFIREGGYFTVCTGRIFHGFHLYDPRYINAPVILGNGAMAYDYGNKKTVYEDAIGSEGIAVLEDVLNHFPEMCIEIYNFNQVYAININEDTAKHFSAQDIVHKNIASPKEAQLSWTKVMFPAGKNSQALQKLLEAHPEIKYFKTGGEWVEMVKKGIDKGTGILQLGKALGCDKKDIYAVGDGYNDVEMLVAANMGFVPENGSKEAIAVAKRITRSNNDGCIANVIEMLDEMY